MNPFSDVPFGYGDLTQNIDLSGVWEQSSRQFTNWYDMPFADRPDTSGLRLAVGNVYVSWAAYPPEDAPGPHASGLRTVIPRAGESHETAQAREVSEAKAEALAAYERWRAQERARRDPVVSLHRV